MEKRGKSLIHRKWKGCLGAGTSPAPSNLETAMFRILPRVSHWDTYRGSLFNSCAASRVALTMCSIWAWLATNTHPSPSPVYPAALELICFSTLLSTAPWLEQEPNKEEAGFPSELLHPDNTYCVNTMDEQEYARPAQDVLTVTSITSRLFLVSKSTTPSSSASNGLLSSFLAAWLNPYSLKQSNTY